MTSVFRPALLGLFCAFLVLASCDQKSSEALRTDFSDQPSDAVVVGFYNLENLFDTDDDPNNFGDDEWLPEAPKHWTPKRYQEKLGRMAKTILDMGNGSFSGGPVLLGVSEIENEKVLRDLIAQPALASSDYGIVHFESADYRGIDNGLIYRKEFFTPLSARPVNIQLPMRPDSTFRTTRDIVYVKGTLLGDTIVCLVNHWPSRSGGEAASRPGRAAAAERNRQIIDSVMTRNPNLDLIVMGDLNDDPKSPSLTKVLRAASRRADAGQTGLYNPMSALYNQGEGSLGYRDAWNLFDQIIVSEGLAKPGDDWTLRNVGVFRKNYLLQQSGRFRGYPLRTYVGDNYKEGYSDHLPVYAVLIRPKK